MVRAQGGPIRLRCSLETEPTHMRSVCVKDYLDKIEAESKGAIKPGAIHQLFRTDYLG
jgi:hypothetical protein